MRHVIGISGGKDSVALALRLRETEPNTDFDFLITPVGNELEEMEQHWKRLEVLLGKPFIRLQPFGPGDGLMRRILDYNALPNWRQRWCTRELKIEPTIGWLKEHAPCVQNVGLRADEEERLGIYGDIPGVTQRYPLREWGWGIEDVWNYLAEKGIRIPKRTDCAFCYGQRLIEWKRLWQEHPDLFEQAVQLEQKTGHTFRSPRRDSWPASLAELRERFEAGDFVKGEQRPGMLQLDLFKADADADETMQACRVCRL